ncbi:MAG TPA: hypothetical protein VGG14_19295 [Candidatus Sulfotelmatobacter sp.]|jgi:hypothetical protein
MHIHPNQINPNAQLDSLQSAQKAAAATAAARTRKRLMEAASKLAGEAASEAFVVDVESNEDSREGDHRRRKPGGKGNDAEDRAEENHSVSDWA